MSRALRILNRDALLVFLATSRTSLFRRINDGLFPPGFPIAGNRIGWLEREAEDFVKLMASDASDSQVRTWVRDVMAARKRLNPARNQNHHVASLRQANKSDANKRQPT